MGCAQPDADISAAEDCAIRFEDVATAAGLDFVHFDSARAALLPEDNGSGLAFADYDNDGYDDLYVVTFIFETSVESSKAGE